MESIILKLAMICFGISVVTFAAIVLSIFPWSLKATIAAMQVATTPKPESNEPPSKSNAAKGQASPNPPATEAPEGENQAKAEKRSPKPTIDLEEAVYHVMRTKQTLAGLCLGLAALMMICSTVLIMAFGRPVEREEEKRNVDAIKPIAIDAIVNVRVATTNAKNTMNAVRTNSATGTETLPAPISETSGTNRSAKPNP